MAKDRFGYGNEEGDNNEAIFYKALMEVGIPPSTSQANLWKIYNEAEKTKNTAITDTLNKYWDWWN